MITKTFFGLCLALLLSLTTIRIITAQECNSGTATSSNSCTAKAIGNELNLCTSSCSPSAYNCDPISGVPGIHSSLTSAQSFCNNCGDGNCCEILKGDGENYVARCYRNNIPTLTPTPLPEPTPRIDCWLYHGDSVSCRTNGCRWKDPYCDFNPGMFSCNQLCKNQPIDRDANWRCTDECGTCRRYEHPETGDVTYRCLNKTDGSEPTDPPYRDYNPCDGLQDPTSCQDCYTKYQGTWTAFGCISSQPNEFTAQLLRALFAVAGGIAFLIILYGAFLCLTARGDAQKTQACRETITAAITGLLMIIFSIFLINLIFGPYGFLPGYVNVF